MRKKLLAGVVLAVMVTFVAPAAANADNYVPQGGCSMTPSTIEAGQSGTFVCSADTFKPGEDVTYTVSGSNGSNVALTSYRTFGAAHTAATVAKTVKPALADGGSKLTVQVPANATGTYTLTASSASRTVNSSLAVVKADATAASGTSNSAASSDSALAVTGSEFVFTIAWIGGLIVLLGLALLFFLMYRRRHQQPQS